MTQCKEIVSYAVGWHFRQCPNRAKYVITMRDGKKIPVCGVHKRSYKHTRKAIEPIKEGGAA